MTCPRIILLALVLCVSPIVSACTKQQSGFKRLDNMKIQVTKEENRPVSFTNKEAAYYYTQTHENNHEEYSWFQGMNVAKNRVFGGYDLYVGDRKLDDRKAKVWVYPYKMVRKHPQNITETLWMIDHKNVVEVSLAGADESIGIGLKGDQLNFIGKTGGIAYFTAREGDYLIGIGAKPDQAIEMAGQKVYASPDAGGFYISVAADTGKASSMIKETRATIDSLHQERKQHMSDLLSRNAYISSNSDSLDLALHWITLTMDQLVTQQQGYGIYAGLPWFNEYWGRDEFISLPGATLVSGQFKTARKILSSFAEYQQTDESSKFFGRVPNIVNPKNIDYHTTDGTPRFVMELQDYVKYSGDTTLIKKLYPNVKYSIEGALKYWTDDKDYLVHADNETWMDARDKNLVPYTPRGNRANDIQALWYQQLKAGVYFAKYMGDDASAKRWQQIAEKVKRNFADDFTDADHTYLADRLTKNGRADFTFRPNQLFALNMIDDPSFKWKVIKECWQKLVYPWGVSSLSADDDNFHPFHLTDKYPKDAAYHTGTIWLWLNGIAMQRMIEAGQVEAAYQLFRNMNRQALNRGVVGGLGENMDAFPHKGKSWPRPTGTYLQAWSNAEHLRVWYQYFLGVRPDMANNQLTLAPRLPKEITKLDYDFIIGDQRVKASYQSSGDTQTYRYHFGDNSLTAAIDVFPYTVKQLSIKQNATLELTAESDSLDIRLMDSDGELIEEIQSPKSQSRLDLQKKRDAVLGNVHFAHPKPLSEIPVMNK